MKIQFLLFRSFLKHWTMALALTSAATFCWALKGAEASSLLLGQLRREVYLDVPGPLISDLTQSSRFPAKPDLVTTLQAFESPTLFGDNYGERLSGFVSPPISGDYVFYISSDDQGALFLSSDPWSAHKRQIAFEPGWAFARSWVGPAWGRTNQENISLPVRLEAGQLYFVEALHKEAAGGDNFGVAWQMPGAAVPENGSPPIGPEFLAAPGALFDENTAVVRIISPTNGALYAAHANVTMAAYAQHPTEHLESVKFFVDEVLVGQGFDVMNSRQYIYLTSWSNPPPGDHVLTAFATDRAGRTTVSPPVPFTVVTSPPIQPPAIVSQPNSLTNFVGQTAQFKVEAEGTIPLDYQWLFDSKVIPAATNSVLTLINVQTNQAGSYRVDVSNAGGTVSSSEAILTVLTEPPGLCPFVNRTISHNSVHLLAQPGSNVTVYAVEDQQPTGWAAANISHDGVFDPITEKVKFGPYFDSSQRVLSYDAVAPAGFVGTSRISGSASADGVNCAITGDNQIVISAAHPADDNADWIMDLNEVTAYAAVWRSGGVWPLPPNSIPIEYVTRAAGLWRGGERYCLDPAISGPPLWWVNILPARDDWLPPVLEEGGSAVRTLRGSVREAGVVEVRLEVAPPAGTLAFAVEETFPAGAFISAISSGGQADPGRAKIRWGPFSDVTPRTLSYHCMFPAVGPLKFNGAACWDGRLVSVGDSDEVCLFDRWAWSSRPIGGHNHLVLRGAQGETFEVQASNDLVSWTAFAVVTNVLGQIEIPVNLDSVPGQKYFRAKLLRKEHSPMD